MRSATKPNARRKWRLWIDVTASRPLTRRDAAKGLSLVLNERLDLDARPIWCSDPAVYFDKLTVVEPHNRESGK